MLERMFERFTASSRRAVVLSQGEARALKQDHVEPHHLFLGVLTADNATASVVLAVLGVESEGVRRHVVAHYGRGENAPSGHIPFSVESKKIFEYSLRESLALGHTYIGTEHLVLGLISDPAAGTDEVLTALGVRTDAVRKAVMVRLGSPGGAEPTEP
jgi:ATP-dependent Clp protease ATP-binding subunit ClpA